MTFAFTVNGDPVEVEAAGSRRLLDVLREDLALTGTKEGCGEGECGACSVLLDGAVVDACLVPVSQAAGTSVTTVEGLGTEERLGVLQEAAERAANSRLNKKLVTLTCDDPDIVLVGRETILREGRHAGYIASAGYGYTVGRPIGLGYVRNGDGVDDDYVVSGRYELVVAEQRTPATVHLQPLYDPQSLRVKG